VQSLIEYRKRILALDPQKPSPEKLGIGRYHYDNCLKWLKDAGIPPDASADILMNSLINRLAE